MGENELLLRDWEKREPAAARWHRYLNPDPHGAAMLELYGFRRSKRDPCPLTLVKKRCRRFSYSGKWPRCLCEAYHQAPMILDHVRSWVDSKKCSVLTAEPYHVDPARLAAFERDCAALGLVVGVGGVSPWYPGSTTLITVRAKP